jgi:hypothetical protein
VILRRCRIASKTSTGLTVGDGYVNGWKNHHTADLIVTGLTKKSITENLFDKNE